MIMGRFGMESIEYTPRPSHRIRNSAFTIQDEELNPMGKVIIGVDEVGRGCWAGPLVVGAFATPDPLPDWWEEIRDSKRVSEKKRELISRLVNDLALPYSVVLVDSETIDRDGLTCCLQRAAREAVRSLLRDTGIADYEVLIDGDDGMGLGQPIVKGDDRVREIGAASIMAKVYRDHYMVGIGKEYPGYGFEKHKGYGVEQHRLALEELGVTPIHRKSVKPVKHRLSGDFIGKDTMYPSLDLVE